MPRRSVSCCWGLSCWGGWTFLPAAVLGPVAEHLGPIRSAAEKARPSVHQRFHATLLRTSGGIRQADVCRIRNL